MNPPSCATCAKFNGKEWACKEYPNVTLLEALKQCGYTHYDMYVKPPKEEPKQEPSETPLFGGWT